MFQEKRKFYSIRVLFCALILLCAGFVSAQTPPHPPHPAPTVKPKPATKVTPTPRKPVWTSGRQIRNESPMPAEKTLAVDSKVNVKLCVSAGRVKVTGWERDEVRAFVSEGSQVGFVTVQKNRETEKPVWIKVLGYDPTKRNIGRPDECLSGDEIELDVPRNAVVDIDSRESEAIIESVGKVRVKNISGDIFLHDITQGIEATAYEGNVMVERSSGAMSLSTTAGNIVALDVSPSEIGDIFKAKTNSGAIALQAVNHRQLDIGSISGTLRFSGEFLNGGQYSFRTQNGSITLLIPTQTSSRVNATYGLGTFNSEIPLQDVVKPTGTRVQNLSGVLGKGESTVNLTTSSGTIDIKKHKN
jgi:hypothetical protein